jgi:hypothetical protein
MRICYQSFKKVLKREKFFFFFKNSIWVSKNAEFHADFESVEKGLKKCIKKVISKKVIEISTFFTFTHVRQTYNFFLVHFFKPFSTDFDTHIEFLKK